ncbi:MAG: ZPR1 zinc finger domain-containing protein [Candidatus Thorarchaeota archaeon]
MTEEDLTLHCPMCDSGKLIVNSMLYSVPYFNELAMFTMKCPSCNFSHNDIFCPEERKPTRWTLVVDNPDLLRVRVVRSGSGTIRMLEMGIDIEPGPAAEGYISNVEGVLYRARPHVETAVKGAEEASEKKRGKEVLDMLNQAIKGEFTFTLVIEDPAGVSGILPDDLRLVKREELSLEEASQLRGAPAWLDVARDEVQERKG